MDAKALEKKVKDEVKAVAIMLRRRLTQPTTEWDNKPGFNITDPHAVGGDLVCSVKTGGGLEGDLEYFMLDGGTKVRKVTLEYPYVRKTHPRSFNSYPSSSKVAFYGGRHPGIEAREWTKLASLEYSAILKASVDKVLAGYKGKPSVSVSGGRKYIP